jgi:hypothetical protein
MKIAFIRLLVPVIALWGSCLENRALLAQGVTFATNDYPARLGPYTYSIATADVLGTGRPAIITANQVDNTLTVFANFGNGTLFISNASYTVGNSPKCIVAGDINGDGKLDLISVNISDTTVLTNNNFSSFVTSSTLTNMGGNAAALFDLNNDGKPDLIIGSLNNLVVYTNAGSGRFGYVTGFYVPGNVTSMASADLNSDGTVDLVVAVYGMNRLFVFTNNGHGALIANGTCQISNYVRTVVAEDINGDGYPDLIAANLYPPTLLVLTNNGHAIFGLHSTLPVPDGCYSVVAADFNGDGLTDLIAVDGSRWPGILTVFTNSGAGFGPSFTIAAGHESPTIAVADFNGDNKPDILLGNTGNSITVLLNTTPFRPPPLNILSAGNQSVLYWRSPSVKTVLQATTNLANPNWFAITNGAPFQGVTLPRTSPALFFRLQSE